MLRLYSLDSTPAITVIIYSDSNTFIRTEEVSVKEGVEKLKELNRKFWELNSEKDWKITLPIVLTQHAEVKKYFVRPNESRKWKIELQDSQEKRTIFLSRRSLQIRS